MPVDRRELCFRMSSAHHLSDGGLLLLRGINQDQISTRLDVVVEFGELFVFGGYACQATFPGAKQYGYRNCCEVDDAGDVGTERLEYLKQSDANQSGAETD